MKQIGMAAAIWLIAGAAAAQEAPAEKATPQEIAEAKALADRLIADAGAAGVFVNATEDDGLARATHVASGMTCTFDGGPEDRIHIFPGNPRGDDVGCISRDEALDIDLTLYATRYRPMPGQDQVLAGARQAIENRWPDAEAYTGPLPTMTMEGQQPTVSAAYKIQLDGEHKLTMVLVSHRGEWSFKARSTGPYEEPTAVALFTGVLFEAALIGRDKD